jgi:hypothetical protein
MTDLARCPQSGKLAYPSAAAAHEALTRVRARRRSQRRRERHVYRCDTCLAYHIAKG